MRNEKRVITVTLNPMLDKTIYLPDFYQGKIWRSDKVENVAGGKGLNVSFQLKFLGIDSIATGFLGGPVGEQIESLIDKNNIKNDFVKIKDITRIGFTILNESSLEQSSVFEPGHKVNSEEIKSLLDKIIKLSKKAEWLVLSGSVPQPNIKQLYNLIISSVSVVNPKIKIALDSYGKEFYNAYRNKIFIAKQNKSEFEKTFDIKLKAEKDYKSALSTVLGKYSELAVITNGEKPAYFNFKNKCYKAFPPKIKAVNPIGSGDCMLSGLIYGFLKELDITDIIKFSMAASIANASKWEIANCRIKEIKNFLKLIKVEIL